MLIFLYCILGLSKSYDPSTWLEGFYGEDCLPCHSSWRTCSSSSTCDTCQDFMFLNSTTSLCQFCAQDEYFDDTIKAWRGWGSTWEKGCIHRDECLEWAPGTIFDVEILQCVSQCGGDKMELSSSQITMGTTWRGPNIYVDPYSQKVAEFGTLQYPYRTMKAAASEILNHYSHNDTNLTIHTKDCYLQVDNFFIMNITSLKIVNHPDYQALSKRATIVLSKTAHEGISQKTRVHLLSHANVDPSAAISAGNYSDAELAAFLSKNICFFLSRTSLEMENIEIYGDDVENCIRAFYLQEKVLKLGKATLNWWFFVNRVIFHQFKISSFEMLNLSLIKKASKDIKKWFARI